MWLDNSYLLLILAQFPEPGIHLQQLQYYKFIIMATSMSFIFNVFVMNRTSNSIHTPRNHS